MQKSCANTSLCDEVAQPEYLSLNFLTKCCRLTLLAAKHQPSLLSPEMG